MRPRIYRDNAQKQRAYRLRKHSRMRSLFNGDCLAILPNIPDGSVDMVLCDLPYGTTACHWDIVIPLKKLWAEYHRVCKRNAAMVFTASQPFTTDLISSNRKDFRYSLVWEKEQGTNFLNAKKHPLKIHEDVCIFYREPCTYNPVMGQGSPYVSGQGSVGTAYGPGRKTVTVNAEGTRYPKSIIRYVRETGHHPTQKPVGLLEYLIRTYTNAGDTVLDNTMGSGSTGLACQNLGREFIGIEKDADIFETARCRIAHIEKPTLASSTD